MLLHGSGSKALGPMMVGGDLKPDSLTTSDEGPIPELQYY